jgi:glucan 1,3-beta-glucosidase
MVIPDIKPQSFGHISKFEDLLQKTDRSPFIRGVNIGGWLLLERFINPYFFAITDCHLRGDFVFYPGQIDAPPSARHTNPRNCTPIQPYPVDEWTLLSHFSNKTIAKEYMFIHYDNFLTRKDVRLMKEAGVTHIRVPLPHWILESPTIWENHLKNSTPGSSEPWVDGGWAFFVRFVEWCREEGGLTVWPDIHTAPGSQNGFDNSGRAASDGVPTCHGWDNTNHTLQQLEEEYQEDFSHVSLSKNVWRSLRAIQDVTSAIVTQNLTDVVTGFGILNEPFKDCDPKIVKKFNQLAFHIVRNNMGSNTSVYIGDMFNATKWNDGYWTSTYTPPKLSTESRYNFSIVQSQPQSLNYHNTFLDSHYYHGEYFFHLVSIFDTCNTW